MKAAFAGVLSLSAFGLVTIAAMFGAISESQVTPTAVGFAPSKLALKDIPANYLQIYQAAGAKYGLDWTILAGIGKIETNHGRLKAPGVTSGVNSYGCCAGPMQFSVVGPGGGTWGAYGQGGNVYDPADAIPAAARYLKASGAPGDYEKAILAYNHAGWYVADVLAQAKLYRGAAQSGNELSSSMTPKEIIDQIVLPIAGSVGIHKTVAQNDADNAAHGPTVNGGLSDHQGPPTERWAADMSNGSSPTPEMDRLAQALADKFGIPWPGYGVAGITRDGFRFQMLYKTTVGGNHFNHIHLGVAVSVP